jgi:uncharacterized damage-inducible protein DinB
MKKTQSNVLIDRLQNDVRSIILEAEKLKLISNTKLEQPPAPGSWSAAQVLEHLNIYCRYYINTIENRMAGNPPQAKLYFNPGWLGNYFTRLMEVDGKGKVKKKMKAPKNAIPAAQPDGRAMLNEFLQHQHQLMHLLEMARNINLHIRIPISLSRLIKLKLGDTFRFVIAHQQRHWAQAERALIANG